MIFHDHVHESGSPASQTEVVRGLVLFIRDVVWVLGDSGGKSPLPPATQAERRALLSKTEALSAPVPFFERCDIRDGSAQ
jgi:hypothetical protein